MLLPSGAKLSSYSFTGGSATQPVTNRTATKSAHGPPNLKCLKDLFII